ncbi:hypothetical protein [Ulvibacter litoralis]|uniref:Uncharacterized protein n=1 Tax=Ulvibacter litoralis TaxID=227084 RepID=A0A1G7GD70_9FLAO|nr:hypothetical protein [Ulvibacter litoralis]GHC56703.1 hypothetical protein GCM10008083_21610 [Ulvibacter litoralis]SDE86031.1 hypothetical protein SAMN05421855_10358 [Ulvibacter litoralis]
MKYTYNNIISFLLLSFVSITTYSQIGIGTSAPNGVLDITSTTYGVVYPTVSLTSLTAQIVTNPSAPAIVAGTTVYNTATTSLGTNSVYPGIYVWTGAKWVPQFDKNDAKIYIQDSNVRTGSSNLLNPVAGNQTIGFDTSTNYPFRPSFNGRYKIEIVVHYGGGKIDTPNSPSDQKVNYGLERGEFDFTFNGTTHSFNLSSYSGNNDDKLFKGGNSRPQRVYTNAYRQATYSFEEDLSLTSTYNFSLTFNQENAPGFEGNGDYSLLPSGDGRGYVTQNQDVKCSVEITYVGE